MARGHSVVGNLVLWEGSMSRAGSCSRRAPARRHVHSCVGQSLDLQKQRDKFALAMCVGLGKDRFQLIACRLP
jgi:hypothetical protein